MRFSALLTGILLVTCFSCNNAPDKTEEQGKTATPATPPPPAQTSLGETGTSNLMALLSAYYELKDALVATNPGKADAAASRVLSAAETMKNTYPEATTKAQATGYIDTIMNASEAIVNVKDETCEKKRAQFEHVSDAMFNLVKTAGLKNGGVYRQYCPMAFNDKGAYWLSNEEEIKNPYFGKKMLECGEVRDSL